MATYTLDTSKWRSGGHGPYKLGKGDTLMCNKQGYMCCLGQFSGLSPERLLGKFSPRGVARDDGRSYDLNFVSDTAIRTDLSDTLMLINDLETLTAQQRVDLIREVLETEGHELVVVDEQGLVS